MQPINYMTKTNQFRSKPRRKGRGQKRNTHLNTEWLDLLVKPKKRRAKRNDICSQTHTHTHAHIQIFWLVQNWNEIIAYNKITAINVIMNHRTSHAILWYMMKVQDAVLLRAFIIIIISASSSLPNAVVCLCTVDKWMSLNGKLSVYIEYNVWCVRLYLLFYVFFPLCILFISLKFCCCFFFFGSGDPCTPRKPHQLISIVVSFLITNKNIPLLIIPFSFILSVCVFFVLFMR